MDLSTGLCYQFGGESVLVSSGGLENMRCLRDKCVCVSVCVSVGLSVSVCV